MAKYIGSNSVVTQVDGYNRDEAEDRFISFDETGGINDINIGQTTPALGTFTKIVGTDSMAIGEGRTVDGQAFIDFVGDTTYTDYGLRIIRRGTANGSTGFEHRGTGALEFVASEAAVMRFLTSNTERMRINGAGSVGIGTADPLAPLHISESGSPNGIEIDPNISGNTRILSYDRTNNIYIPAENVASLHLWRTGTTERMRLSADGWLGIGTSSPGEELHIKSDVPAIMLEDSTDGSYGLVYYNTGSHGLVLAADQGASGQIASNIVFTVDGSEKTRINSSGDLLLGKTTVSVTSGVGAMLHSSGYVSGVRDGAASAHFTRLTTGGSVAEFRLGSTLSGYISVGSARMEIIGSTGMMIQTADSTSTVSVKGGAGAPGGQIDFIGGNSTGELIFRSGTGTMTEAPERMRLSAGGELLVGTTSSSGIHTGATADDAAIMSPLGHVVAQRSNDACLFLSKPSGYTNGTLTRFYVNTTLVGSIATDGASTSYNTTSDYRLKENVVTLQGSLSIINKIQVRKFNFLHAPNKIYEGFIAHELQAVVPNAVSGEKDAVDENGNPEYQSVDHSKLVPILVSGIQDLMQEHQNAMQKIKDLEARVAQLEGTAA